MDPIGGYYSSNFMPTKKKSKNRRRAKRGRSAAPTVGGRGVASVMLRQTPIFPPSKFVKGQLYYEYQLTITSTTGVPSFYVFSANGAFDPNITGTGHQPMGFDNMMEFYDQYCVRASSIKVSLVGLSTSVGRVGLLLYDQPSPSTTPERLVENGLMKMAVVSSSTAGGTKWSVEELSLHCDVPKYFGAKFNEMKVNPSFIGTAAANPTEQVYFVIVLWGGFSNSTMQISMDVVLSYDVFYYEPRHPNISAEAKDESVLVHRPPVTSKNPRLSSVRWAGSA